MSETALAVTEDHDYILPAGDTSKVSDDDASMYAQILESGTSADEFYVAMRRLLLHRKALGGNLKRQVSSSRSKGNSETLHVLIMVRIVRLNAVLAKERSVLPWVQRLLEACQRGGSIATCKKEVRHSPWPTIL